MGILAVVATVGVLRTSLLSSLFLLLCKIFFNCEIYFKDMCLAFMPLSFSVLKTNTPPSRDDGRWSFALLKFSVHFLLCFIFLKRVGVGDQYQ